MAGKKGIKIKTISKFFIGFILVTLIFSTVIANAEDLESLVVTDPSSGQTTTLMVQRSAIAPSELAVLINDNDPQSVAVANYYQTVRNIPDQNMIHLSFPVSYLLTVANFNAAKAQIDAAVGPNIQGFVVTWTQPWKVGETYYNYGMSITSAFALGLSSSYFSPTCNSGSCNCPVSVNYYNSASVKPYTDLGIRPTMMLGGYTAQDVFALIDKGALAAQNFPTGDGYFVRTTDSLRSVRYPYFQSTVNNWSPTPLQMTYIDNSTNTSIEYIQNTSDILIYQTGLRYVYYFNTNQYLPGALADHLTSYGGILIGSSQMSVLDWLKAGVTASYGTVNEPCNYTQKFPNSSVLVPQYFSGETALEAYWKSVNAPQEGVFVGDPLARPYGTKATLQNGDLQIVTTILKPGRSYTLFSGDSEAGPFTAIQSNIALSKYNWTTLNVGQADKPFYKLVDTGSSNADTTAPAAPSLSSPASFAKLMSVSTFSWQNVNDPSGVTYRLQVDDESTFPSPSIDISNITGTSYATTTNFPVGTYYWRVQAKDGVGNIGAWSELRVFSIVPPDTTAPSISVISPLAGSNLPKSVTIKGQATDNTNGSGIAQINLLKNNVIIKTCGGSAQTMTCEKKINVGQFSMGSNTITVTAKDAAGNSSSASIVAQRLK